MLVINPFAARPVRLIMQGLSEDVVAEMRAFVQSALRQRIPLRGTVLFRFERRIKMM